MEGEHKLGNPPALRCTGSLIGLGVGLGGNVLLRHALKYPERVDSLVLVNTTCQAGGWIEWGYQKRNVNHLRQHGVTQVLKCRCYVELKRFFLSNSFPSRPFSTISCGTTLATTPSPGRTTSSTCTDTTSARYAVYLI